VRYVNWIGRRLPLHCTASGKVLLADLPQPARAALISGPLRRYTSSTIDSLDRLAEELALVAERGFAVASEEYEQGYSAIAAPIYDHDSRVAGALSVSGPSFRLPRDTLLGFSGPLLDTAARISAEMGYVSSNGANPLSRRKEVEEDRNES
jgi:DNA-binding IclR family transcriptional regulator